MTAWLQHVSEHTLPIIEYFGGQPGVVEGSAVQFLLGAFFAFLLYKVIRVRAENTMHPRHLVAMIGAMFLIGRNLSLFVLDWGWDCGFYTDPFIYLIYPPLEHFFGHMSIMCFGYYAVRYIVYWPHWMERLVWFWFLLPFAILGMSAGLWGQCLNKQTETQCAASHTMAYLSVISNVLFISVCIATLVVVIPRCIWRCRYLIFYFTCNLVEHVLKTFMNLTSYTNEAIILVCNNLHLWAIPLLMFHFVLAYVTQMQRCNVCGLNNDQEDAKWLRGT